MQNANEYMLIQPKTHVTANIIHLFDVFLHILFRWGNIIYFYRESYEKPFFQNILSFKAVYTCVFIKEPYGKMSCLNISYFG